MSSIIIPEEIRKEFRVEANGKSFASIRGTARIADVEHSALIRAFEYGDGKSEFTSSVILYSASQR